MNTQQQEIQEVAYYLWISEGKPDGQSAKHWDIAQRSVAEKHKPKRSIDPSEAKGTTEPEQPDQT
ncbi:MAG TPA: DUF2934 domain-containing protein [Cellvibrio sp.]|nr:DUF2934 domain-containing protein [Cellvibrio sp.]